MASLRRIRATWQQIVSCLLVTLITAPLFAASPSLGIILPRGIQRGVETEVTFNGGRLDDAEEIFFYSPGFEVLSLEATASQVKVKVKVNENARLGEHVAQVRTRSGISEYKTFFVSPYANVDEVEPNSSFDEPQAIAMNVTVQGVVTNEDVDYYVVEAKAGQRISAEVEGMRLGTTQFDPYIAVLNSKRFELSADDDTPLVRQDAVASAVAPEDGKYYIMVRESSYGGNGNCRYRLHVGTFPRPTAVYPAGGKVGEAMQVKFLGDPSGELVRDITVPSELLTEYGLEISDEGGVAPSPNTFMISENDNSLEVEPNNEVAQGSPAALPNAFNGVIQEANDIDCFKFTATKGQVFDIECYARRVRSPLDPVMNLYRANGQSLAGNDDSRGPDSYFRYTFPDDGEYVLRITDHLGRGGADFVYRVEFRAVKPVLTLGIPRVARYSQYRQQIYVARGNRFATLMSASRSNFGGDLTFEGNNLPEGISMVTENMPSNMSVAPIVFEATADAPLAGKLVDFQAKHVDANTGITGGFRNRADLIIGAPGQSLYVWKDVGQLAVAVVDELPFQLEIVQPNVPIVQNGEMQLKIVAHRKEGFTKAINVQFPFRPPGIGTTSSVNIPEGQNEVLYPLNAAGNAQVREWPIYALGSSDVNGAAWVSSQLAKLNVTAPIVNVAMERASCEQGQETQLVVNLTHVTEFEGTAKLELVGLPAKAATQVLDFTKETEQLIFNITTAADTPAGKHNVFCKVHITQNEEPIIARSGGTQLQVDKPLPPPPNAKPMPKPMPMATAEAPKPAPKPMAKPLTRLEKLRLAAKERAQQTAGSEEE